MPNDQPVSMARMETNKPTRDDQPPFPRFKKIQPIKGGKMVKFGKKKSNEPV